VLCCPEARACDIARAVENTVWVVRADVAGRTTTHASEGATGVVAPSGTVVCTTQRSPRSSSLSRSILTRRSGEVDGTPNVTRLCSTEYRASLSPPRGSAAAGTVPH
jgi:hypothetical protein